MTLSEAMLDRKSFNDAHRPIPRATESRRLTERQAARIARVPEFMEILKEAACSRRK